MQRAVVPYGLGKPFCTEERAHRKSGLLGWLCDLATGLICFAYRNVTLARHPAAFRAGRRLRFGPSLATYFLCLCKESKQRNTSRHPALRFATGSLPPVPLRGPARKGHPWPCHALRGHPGRLPPAHHLHSAFCKGIPAPRGLTDFTLFFLLGANLEATNPPALSDATVPTAANHSVSRQILSFAVNQPLPGAQRISLYKCVCREAELSPERLRQLWRVGLLLAP